MKPQKTKILYQSEVEHLEYNERRNFPNYRDMAHYYFDKLWQSNLFTRQSTYIWLSGQMNLPLHKTHFRLFNDKQCLEATKICQQQLNDLRSLDLSFGAKPLTPHYIYLKINLVIKNICCIFAI